MDLLKDKLALITGAGGGLGAAMASGFVREGARVIVADVAHEKAQAVAQALRDAGGQAWAEALDVTDRAACQAFAQAVGERHGAIDEIGRAHV